MWLFGKKKNINVDDVVLKTAISAIEIIGKLKKYDNVDDIKCLSIGLGYFFGYYEMQLIRFLKKDIANTIVEKSISELNNVLKDNDLFCGFANDVLATKNNAIISIKNDSSKSVGIPYLMTAADYLIELYNHPKSLDAGETISVANEMKYLNESAAIIAKRIKIIKTSEGLVAKYDSNDNLAINIDGEFCDVCGADITDDIDVCHVCGKAK